MAILRILGIKTPQHERVFNMQIREEWYHHNNQNYYL